MPCGNCVSRRLLAPILVVSAVLAGCSRGPVFPPPVAVSGKVTVNGKALDGGTVHFTPVDSMKALPGHAAIQADGSYTATTRKAKDGLTPGEFIVWFDQAEPKEKKGKVVSPIPGAYLSPGESRLKKTIDSKGGVVDLAVTGK